MPASALSRRHFLRGVGTAAAALGTGALLRGAEERPPNVVFILIDDLGWKDISCYGSRFYETPHVDRLAAMGMRFTDGYAACTVCSPTRASVMTGKYPARLHLTDWIAGHGRPRAKLRIPDWHKQLEPSERCLPEAFKGAGYATGFIGKWHLGPTEEYWPDAQGFDLNVGGYHRGQPPSYFSPYRIPTMDDGPKGEYLTDRHAADAEAFMEANRDRPFLLYLSMYAVHTPLQAKKELIERYRRKAEADPENAQGSPVYAAMIESMDDCVGRVLDKLQALGLSDRTVVWFTGDNGGLVGNPKRPVTSNSPLRAGKGSAYEGGVREPFLVHWPGVTKPRSTCPVPVMTIDVYPTLLEIAGIRDDPQHAAVTDGVSLVPLLKGGTALPRTALYWHYPHYHPGGATPYGAIRDGDFRLVEFFEDGRVELYNLRDDIGEVADLVGTMPDKAAELHRKLQRWRTSVGAQMPAENPDYDADAKQRGGDPKPAPRKDRPHPSFDVLRGGTLEPQGDQWLMETREEASALRKLAEPITGQATFRMAMKTLLKREQGWQNGYLALSPSEKDADLVLAGAYIGRLSIAIVKGLLATGAAAKETAADYEREQELEISVTVDVPKRTIQIQCAGVTVSDTLPREFDAIRYAGYHAARTRTLFGKIGVQVR